MSVNEIRDFIFEKYYKWIGFFKENSYYSIKRLKKKKKIVVACKNIKKSIGNISDTRNTKGHYQSFIRKKNTKSVKQPDIIIYQLKICFANSNVVNINSVITEHPKTLHKLSKTIRQSKKGGSNSTLFSDTKEVKIF